MPLGLATEKKEPPLVFHVLIQAPRQYATGSQLIKMQRRQKPHPGEGKGLDLEESVYSDCDWLDKEMGCTELYKDLGREKAVTWLVKTRC